MPKTQNTTLSSILSNQPDEEIDLHQMISSNKFGTFFGISQKVLDTVWENLTSANGNSVAYISMEIGADLDVFHPVTNKLNQIERNGLSLHRGIIYPFHQNSAGEQLAKFF